MASLLGRRGRRAMAGCACRHNRGSGKGGWVLKRGGRCPLPLDGLAAEYGTKVKGGAGLGGCPSPVGRAHPGVFGQR